MTPREIVHKTLEFAGPERVARSFGESGGDLLAVACAAKTRATPWREVGGGRWERIDEWGNTLARLDATSKGEVVKGVLDDLSRLDRCGFPDYSDPKDYACVAEAKARSPRKWILGRMPGFTFNIARQLRRFDQYLVDLMLEPDLVRELHDRVDAMLEEMILNYARAGADGIFFLEDWGTQTGVMISPELWRREFYPRSKRLCGLAREGGMKVFMHSCGKIGAIVPGLIEAGVDVFQFDQPDLHGIDNLAAYQESAKATFWCPVDIQETLQRRSERAIRAKAREMVEKLWRGRGGFIAGCYEDDASIGLDPKWQRIACDEFVARGVRENFGGSRGGS